MFEFNVTMGVNIKIKINFLHSPNLKVNTQHIAYIDLTALLCFQVNLWPRHGQL